ncbi:hypothetical protein M422DRAFT_262173 [Sphaerobolus stellatus SS14]|uniref:F-box domain-containing protein n=1 Tax=Sphaerobolus stellatus (strain SS14) TaxID=990650 RepID=A0A0C9UL20_SPHS4|nr:hypothetical protein M422DRAFT_262173 [Sphaerobolus stellatus SS14]
MFPINISEDAWLYLSDNYLEKQDIYNLSMTCRTFRTYLLPIVFRKLTFSGLRANYSESITRRFAHLKRLEQHIDLLRSDERIFSAVRRVEMRNWVYFKQRNIFSGRENTSKLIQKLTEVWSAAYQAVVALINDLPNLQYISFYEGLNSTIPMVSPFSDPSLRTYCPLHRSEYLEFHLFDLHGNTARFTIPNSIETLRSPSLIPRLSRSNYFHDILSTIPHRLVSARLNSRFLANLPPFVITKFKSLHHLAIVIFSSATDSSENLHRIFFTGFSQQYRLSPSDP